MPFTGAKKYKEKKELGNQNNEDQTCGWDPSLDLLPLSPNKDPMERGKGPSLDCVVQGSPTKVVIANGTYINNARLFHTTNKVTTRGIPIRIWDKDERWDRAMDKTKAMDQLD